MLRLSILSARGRLGTFTGALIALFAASVLAMAWGMQLESMLRTHAPVERYVGAAAVVAGQQNVGADHDVQLTERARVSTALTARLAGLPGVRAAIGDVSVPARLGDRADVAHGWSSAVLTPYVLSAGRPPARPDEVVTGYPAVLGARLPLASTARMRMVTVVGVARPRHPVTQQSAIFLTDAEATALAGHPGRVDAIGLLAGPGFDINRVRAAASGAQVLTGAARGQGEYPELEATRTALIPVTAAFGGLALFIAMFVVASTLSLSIQQREREIALLRAVATTPGQIRRMIAWEAAIIAMIGSAAGIWPGIVLGRTLAHGLVRHGIAPANFALNYDWLPAAAVIGCAVATSLLAVLAAGRRAARVPPTLALTDAAVEPRLLGPGRIIGGLLALACADAAVHRVGHHQHARYRRGDSGNDRDLPRRGGRLPGTDLRVRGRSAAGAGARGDLAGRRLPRLRQPAHRLPALLLGQHPTGAHRRHELHASVQHDHHRARHHPAKARRADRPARPHQHRSGTAHRSAKRRARHPRSTLGRRAHARPRSAPAWATPTIPSPPRSSPAGRAADSTSASPPDP